MEGIEGSPSQSARGSHTAPEEILRAKREEANQQSGLHRIPPECCNKIISSALEECLVNEVLPIASEGLSARRMFLHHVRGLAQTCRTLRTETTYIFWGSNHFRFDLRDPDLFCEGLKFVVAASTKIRASLRKFDFAPTYWQPKDWALPAITFLIDRERERVRVIDRQRDSSRQDRWRDVYLDLSVGKIEAIGPHKTGEPLSTKQLAQMLKLMCPKTFWQIARAKCILR